MDAQWYAEPSPALAGARGSISPQDWVRMLQPVDTSYNTETLEEMQEMDEMEEFDEDEFDEME